VRTEYRSIRPRSPNRGSLPIAIADRYGSQAVVVALSGRRSRHTSRRKGRNEDSTLEWAIEAASRGAGEILLTLIRQDGMRTGFDLELTTAVRSSISIPVIA